MSNVQMIGMRKPNGRPVQREITGPQVSSLIPQRDSHWPILPKKGLVSYAEYRKLRKDPTIALCRKVIPGPILAAGWSIQANKVWEEWYDRKVPKKWIAFIKHMLEPIKEELLTTAIQGLIDFGWQGYEKVWKKDKKGYTVLTNLKSLIHDYTDILITQTGAFAGFRQGVYQNVFPTSTFQAGGYTYIWPPKALLLNIYVEGTDWYGNSSLEDARQSIEDWNESNAGAKKYDRKIAGSHWVIYYPIGASDFNGETDVDNYIIAKQILSTMEASGGVVVPNTVAKYMQDLNQEAKGWEIELLSDSSARQYSFTNRLEYLDACKVRAMGLPEKAVLEGRFGSKAETGVHANIAATGIDVLHRNIVNGLNLYAINQILRLNFGMEAQNAVVIVPAPITDSDKELLQFVYRQMANSPEIFGYEYNNINWPAFRDKLSIPHDGKQTEWELQQQDQEGNQDQNQDQEGNQNDQNNDQQNINE